MPESILIPVVRGADVHNHLEFLEWLQDVLDITRSLSCYSGMFVPDREDGLNRLLHFEALELNDASIEFQEMVESLEGVELVIRTKKPL